MRYNGSQMARYEITVMGHIEGSWSEWFNNMDIDNLPTGEAVLSGTVVDQAALHGLLIKIRDLGLPLLSVHIVQPDRNGAQRK